MNPSSDWILYFREELHRKMQKNLFICAHRYLNHQIHTFCTTKWPRLRAPALVKLAADCRKYAAVLLFRGFAIRRPVAIRIRRMNILSILVGALFAALAICGTDLLLAERGSSFITLGWPGMALFLAVAAGSAWLGRVCLLLMLVMAWRPRAAISWWRPAQCASLRDWASSSWDIRTPVSRQTGHRVFGLNMAMYGEMPKTPVATPDRSTPSR